MYHWIEDKQFQGRMRALCSDIVNQLVQAVNREGALSVRQHLVGSGAKNLITQNANQPVDLDYNLEIVEAIEYDINDCRGIKEYVRKKFNEVLNRADLGDCSDSTSALTTRMWHFTEGNSTEFSIDLCIVCADDDDDRYFWNEVPSSNGLAYRVRWLKKNGCWLEVRETYLEKKNMYLSRGDHNHPSFICYIEAVNEVFNKYA